MTLDNLSSGQFWIYGVITAFIDLFFLFFLTWRIKALHFHKLKWVLVGTAAISWSIFAVLLVSISWDTYYQYFYPSWFRSGGILLFVPIVFGVLALVFHWLAFHMPGNPIVIFCLLGGVESVVEHLWGIYGFKILEIPLLQGVSPASILAFCLPEYIFYWCVVISIAAIMQNIWKWLTDPRRTRATIA